LQRIERAALGLFGASFFIVGLGYQKLSKVSNTADQSNRKILVTCIGENFLYEFLERLTPCVTPFMPLTTFTLHQQCDGPKNVTCKFLS